MSSSIWRMITLVRPTNLFQRWHLTVYLDNGRSLRSYGTLSASINYEFDFGEARIDRVVFQAGTFGNEVALFTQHNWEGGPCFRSGPCDERFEESRKIRSYKVVWTI